MKYLITSGCHSDFGVVALLEAPASVDRDQVRQAYETVVEEHRAALATYFGDEAPEGVHAAPWPEDMNEVWVKVLVERFGFVKLDYLEWNEGPTAWPGGATDTPSVVALARGRPCWVAFANPSDFPDQHVARFFDGKRYTSDRIYSSTRTGLYEAVGQLVGAASFDWIARDDSDDKVIGGVWL